jgi:hypothetical protein
MLVKYRDRNCPGATVKVRVDVVGKMRAGGFEVLTFAQPARRFPRQAVLIGRASTSAHREISHRTSARNLDFNF